MNSQLTNRIQLTNYLVTYTPGHALIRDQQLKVIGSTRINFFPDLSPCLNSCHQQLYCVCGQIYCLVGNQLYTIDLFTVKLITKLDSLHSLYKGYGHICNIENRLIVSQYSKLYQFVNNKFVIYPLILQKQVIQFSEIFLISFANNAIAAAECQGRNLLIDLKQMEILYAGSKLYPLASPDGLQIFVIDYNRTLLTIDFTFDSPKLTYQIYNNKWDTDILYIDSFKEFSIYFMNEITNLEQFRLRRNAMWYKYSIDNNMTSLIRQIDLSAIGKFGRSLYNLKLLQSDIFDLSPDEHENLIEFTILKYVKARFAPYTLFADIYN
ncbi:Hypothetical_protein [Hexamita inflata]|uniref:Hypothetical_protein n=1 Tax=Hexamita inflata TaxID=28002 RepID=A0AA86PVH8_9EUKA|nr:Hypothetical protein HINF_LOCUS34386 [Hexamita inflata]CAI9976025.1 Hypothetical protein HINF_LOCUS63670 [Hexamita inflata]